MDLFTTLTDLMSLTKKVDVKEEPSFTPNICIRVDTDNVFWVEIDSEAVSYMNGSPLIEEAHNVIELQEVIEGFARKLVVFREALEGA